MTGPCPACGGVLPSAGRTGDVCGCGLHWGDTPAVGRAARRVRDAGIVADYRRGDPVERIAARHGVSRGRVSQIAATVGIPLRRPQNAPKGVDAARVIADRRHGLKIRQIAERHGVTESTVRHHLGLTRRAAAARVGGVRRGR
ncbi:hypothetical protein SAMN05421505_120116 [Sinosporangium album]|uniref:Uncharacterized protein n=1 Tax=Sinosporangium album TaxID=504805 RepID=A0A1G8EIR6_9ACTN|nr:hypothetical protein [Sinosporangium album]SDH69700.1 hypothetical protein SAMN05421505_120116 [Sinosporangium album]